MFNQEDKDARYHMDKVDDAFQELRHQVSLGQSNVLDMLRRYRRLDQQSNKTIEKLRRENTAYCWIAFIFGVLLLISGLMHIL